MLELEEKPNPFWYCLKIVRNRTVYCTYVRDYTTVRNLKEIIHDPFSVEPNDQQLYYNKWVMDDDKPLSYYGILITAENPVLIGVTFRKDDGNFEELDIDPEFCKNDLYV